VKRLDAACRAILVAGRAGDSRAAGRIEHGGVGAAVMLGMWQRTVEQKRSARSKWRDPLPGVETTLG